MVKKIPVIFFLLLLYTCKDVTRSEVVVYSNDFENANLSQIKNGIINQFNGSNILGPYNKGDFELTVNNLPKHDLITISFDLFIHDSWDGNKPPPDGPDVWQMLADGNSYINTTFSNAQCGANEFCAPQAYPLDYPNNYNNPKTGAFRTDLPGFCSLKTSANGTTQYKITKTFKHTESSLTLQCLDKLVQTNTADPKCDESWSVDNIIVKTIAL